MKISNPFTKKNPYSDLRRELSLENYFFKEKEPHYPADEALLRKSSISTKLGYFDLLTNVGSYFFVQKKKKFTTNLGGFLSIIFILGIFPITYFFGQDFWLQKNPVVTTLALPFKSAYSTGKYKFDLNIPIVFGLPKLWENLNTTYEFVYESKTWKVHNCSDAEFSTFYKEKRNETMNYFCSNVNLLFEELYSGNGRNLNFMSIFPRCVKNKECSDEINQALY